METHVPARVQMKAACLFHRCTQTKLHILPLPGCSELEESLGSARINNFRFCLLSDQQGLCVPSSHLPQSEQTSWKKKQPLRLKKKVKKKTPALRPNPHDTGFCLSAPLHLLLSALSASQIYLSRPAREGPLPESRTARLGLMEGENAIVPCSCFTQDTKTASAHTLL